MSATRPLRIMRYGAGALSELAEVCAEVGIERPMLVTTRRGAAAVGPLPVVGLYDGVRPHVPVETVREAAARAEELDADGLVGMADRVTALGGRLEINSPAGAGTAITATLPQQPL